MKNLFLVLIILIIINCRGEQKKDSKPSSSKSNISQIQKSILVDFTAIDNSSIGKEIVSKTSKDKLLLVYKKALENDFERPYMWDAFLPENENLIKFYSYQNYLINNQNFNSYYIKIQYEDAKYEAILLTTNNLGSIINDKSSLIVYENLISEELYKRISKVANNNILDIILQKNKKQYKHLQYLLYKNMFLDYFMENNDKINKNWGEKEEIGYEYQIKGNIQNHLKNGHWEEKRYSFEYNKSVWMDGDYYNGIRNKEWNISPDGPVEKVNIYNNGSIIKTFSP